MTLKEFASLLDGREYRCEITPSEEALAKELGFVVVFGYSDDNAELRGAINDEIGCFDGGVLEHEDLPKPIYAYWCPATPDCAWAYGTDITHERFCIYDHGELYCVGIVCDINKPKPTNADRIRAMTDEELEKFINHFNICDMRTNDECKFSYCACCEVCVMDWLQQPAEGDA